MLSSLYYDECDGGIYYRGEVNVLPKILFCFDVKATLCEFSWVSCYLNRYFDSMDLNGFWAWHRCNQQLPHQIYTF